MTIKRIHSYLVHPSKHEANPAAVGGVEVPQTGRLFEMLQQMDYSALSECDIEIMFRSNPSGAQQNDCRDLLLKHLGKPTLETGLAIANRLQSVTTKRSGLGLLFVITAQDQHGLRLLVSRFPAVTAVMAEEHGQRLSVQFVEKVFMKSAHSYKSVLYRCKTVQTGFWDGVAVDRQMDEKQGSADYWIREFLASELRNTSAQGTKRVAIAVQAAIKETDDPTVKRELIHAAHIMRNRDKQTTSGAKMAQELRLNKKAADTLRDAFPRPENYSATFRFDVKEFDKNLKFRSVELDNGAMMIAENKSFDDVFHSERVDRHGSSVRFTTEGSVVATRLRKTR